MRKVEVKVKVSQRRGTCYHQYCVRKKVKDSMWCKPCQKFNKNPKKYSRGHYCKFCKLEK